MDHFLKTTSLRLFTTAIKKLTQETEAQGGDMTHPVHTATDVAELGFDPKHLSPPSTHSLWDKLNSTPISWALIWERGTLSCIEVRTQTLSWWTLRSIRWNSYYPGYLLTGMFNVTDICLCFPCSSDMADSCICLTHEQTMHCLGSLLYTAMLWEAPQGLTEAELMNTHVEEWMDLTHAEI